MKKTKKLLCFLFSAIMVLALIGTALALTDVDPNLCNYCGIGTYSESTPNCIGVRIGNAVPCQHGYSGYKDGMLQGVYVVDISCTYPGCYYFTTQQEFIYRDIMEICTHEYDGMSVDDVVS